MHSIAGVYDGHTIKPSEAIVAAPNTKVITTFLEDGPLARPFPTTRLEEVAGCLPYEGAAKTVEEMNEAVRRHAREQWR